MPRHTKITIVIDVGDPIVAEVWPVLKPARELAPTSLRRQRLLLRYDLERAALARLAQLRRDAKAPPADGHAAGKGTGEQDV